MKFSIFNLWTAGVVGMLLVPNIIYALRHRDGGVSGDSRAISILEQTGRYGSMIFMVVPLGVKGGEFGFRSVEELILWGAGTAALLAAYYAC